MWWRVGERVVVKQASLRVIQQLLRRIGVRVTQKAVGKSLSRLAAHSRPRAHRRLFADGHPGRRQNLHRYLQRPDRNRAGVSLRSGRTCASNGGKTSPHGDVLRISRTSAPVVRLQISITAESFLMGGGLRALNSENRAVASGGGSASPAITQSGASWHTQSPVQCIQLPHLAHLKALSSAADSLPIGNELEACATSPPCSPQEGD